MRLHRHARSGSIPSAVGLGGTLLLASIALLAQGPSAGDEGAAHLPAKKPVTSEYSAKPPLGDSEKRPVESAVQASGRAVLERRMGGPEWPGEFGTIEDPGRAASGATESTAVSIEDVAGVPEAFPSNAQAVIVGTVQDAGAFLSPDRKFVYSDFHVKVESVLRQDQSQPLAVGDSVVSYRNGGALKFPSGHITNFIIYGHGFPFVGGRYIVFLWRFDGLFGRYSFGTAYQLKGGLTFALDAGGPYSGYNGMAEDVFLEKIRQAIQNPSSK